MRIVDVLRQPDESEIDAAQKKGKDSSSWFSSAAVSSCSRPPSLKRVVWKWVASVKRKKRGRESGSLGKQNNGGEWMGLGYCWDGTNVGKRKEEEEEEGECGSSSSSPLPPDPIFCDHRKESIVGRDGHSLGSNFDGSCFNVGIGVALMLLLTKAASEYNKMTELRKQMETFFKDSTPSKDGESCLAHPEQSEGKHSSSVCTEASDDRISCNYITLSMNQSYDGGEQTSGSPMEGDGRPNMVEEEPVYGRAMGIDQLEAELESELEQLQVNMEEEIEGDPRFVEHEDEVSFDNLDLSTKEEENGQHGGKYEEQEWEYRCGVCPHELERRLHELLEARQQEQIQELESDLREARRLLQEKEMEAYWRNNLSLLSQSNRGCRSC